MLSQWINQSTCQVKVNFGHCSAYSLFIYTLFNYPSSFCTPVHYLQYLHKTMYFSDFAQYGTFLFEVCVLYSPLLTLKI